MRPLRSLRSIVVSACLGLVFLAATPREAAAAGGGEAAEASSSEAVAARNGLRFRAGAFGLAHARIGDEADPASVSVVPGIALSPSYTLGAWDLGIDARAAFRPASADFGGRKETLLAAVGPRVRWFTSADASVAPFVTAGFDLFVFTSEHVLHGVGPSAHAGAGLEVFHDARHGRLAFELGIDAPLFAMTVSSHPLGGSDGGDYSPTLPRPAGTRFYMAPVTLAANWTF